MSSIYARAIAHFGVPKQLCKAEEELLELLCELVKKRNGCQNDREIIGEIADVLVMAEQLRIIFGPAQVDRAMDEKLTRLVTRIGTESSK